MGVISIILLVIFILSASLLILLVMLQDEGSEGMGGIFGGGGGSSQIGNRSGNILTKATSILGAVFIITAFALAWFSRTPDSGDIEQAAARLRGGEGSSTEWWLQDDADEEPGILQELDLPDVSTDASDSSE